MSTIQRNHPLIFFLFFISGPIFFSFFFFAALFKTFGLQIEKDVMVIFFLLKVFQKSEILKNTVSERLCMGSSLFSHSLSEVSLFFFLPHAEQIHRKDVY